MAYGNFKSFSRRTAFYKILRGKASNMTKTTRYDGYQHGLTSKICKCFNKKLLVEPLRLQINLQLKMKIFLIND